MPVKRSYQKSHVHIESANVEIMRKAFPGTSLLTR